MYFPGPTKVLYLVQVKRFQGQKSRIPKVGSVIDNAS